MHATCRIRTFDMTHSYAWHVLFVRAPCHIYICDGLIHMCDMPYSYTKAFFIRATCRDHMCDIPHSYVRHASCIHAIWQIHTRGMPHSYVRHDRFIRAACLIRMCDMTDSYVCHASFICVTCLIHVCDSVTLHLVCSWASTRVTWCFHIHIHINRNKYGVASISRLLKIIGLFCKRALQKRLYSANETYDFREPTNRSHLITSYVHTSISRLLKIIGLICKRDL